MECIHIGEDNKRFLTVKLHGILQTNFMLCKMEDEGASYGAALKGN